MRELAARECVPIAGKDFKTGQTWLKTLLAPGLKARMLGLRGWYSTNILGNRDGEVLDDAGNFKTKEVSKLGVIDSVLQPEVYPDLYGNVDHVVRHRLLPAAAVRQSGPGTDVGRLRMDNGNPVQIKVGFLRRGSILARADRARPRPCSVDLASRAGQSGVQEWLSFYFKAPQAATPVPAEHDLFIQQTKLKNALRGWTARGKPSPPIPKRADRSESACRRRPGCPATGFRLAATGHSRNRYRHASFTHVACQWAQMNLRRIACQSPQMQNSVRSPSSPEAGKVAGRRRLLPPRGGRESSRPRTASRFELEPFGPVDNGCGQVLFGLDFRMAAYKEGEDGEPSTPRSATGSGTPPTASSCVPSMVPRGQGPVIAGGDASADSTVIELEAEHGSNTVPARRPTSTSRPTPSPPRTPARSPSVTASGATTRPRPTRSRPRV